nr:retrovirus-related Pol polyprotein from transposon TNT 1-94 [Tanacetum cinerariifolium]
MKSTKIQERKHQDPFGKGLRFYPPMGFKGIAKVAKGWFLGCDQSLDFRGDYQQERRHYTTSGCSGLKKSRMVGKASEDLHLEQLDVKTVFLHGDLDEDICMTQPEDFQSAGKEENLLCKLKKSSDIAEIKKLKRQSSQEFEMKDLCSAKQILGMSIIKDKMKGTLRLSQEKYIGKVLDKFNIKDAEASLVGSVMYAMVCTRPDIAHAVGVVSRFMSNPGREHLEAIKWLLRCLKGTSKATLCFSRKEVVLEGFSDSNYGGCLGSSKSNTGYVFTVGGTIVSWMFRIQKCVVMSTTKSEYIAIAEAGKELHIKIRYYYIREVEALRSFNWPPRKLMNRGWYLTRERGYSQFDDVSQDTLYRKSPSPAFGSCDVSWKRTEEYTKIWNLNEEINQVQDLPIHIHYFGHNLSIPTRIELIQAVHDGKRIIYNFDFWSKS